ncbi:hypothetical protein F2Q68_00039049 [Brassica cretica]|uniref:Uncharacterized protein n=1 Tax=Brassica cretica TaxID=69181 RepID=A0A8S9MMU0_BRACR|nr:hypothetical protein F2Q68_00039049 [Brassica cretica]
MADHLGLKVEPSKESFTFVGCSHRSSGGIVRDQEVQIGNALVPVDFHVLDIKLNWNSSILLGRALLLTVGAVCNMQTNQLCMTLIDPHIHYNPIPVKKPQASSRRIDDPILIASCHCGAENETEYSASIETHTATSIDSAHQKSIDSPKEESVDSSLRDWENDYYNPTMATHTRDTMHTEEYDEYYAEERAIEYIAILDEEDRLLHRSSWKKNAPSIDRTVSTSIDTHPHQNIQKRALTDIDCYPSIDTEFDRVREGDYSIGSWADNNHHESYAVQIAVHEPGADELHEGFTYEELLNMQRRDEADQHQAETCWERTRFSHPCSRVNRPSIDAQHPSSVDIHPKPPSTVSAKTQYDNQYLTHNEFGIFRNPDGHATAIDGHALQVSNEDIADILHIANGADNIFLQQRNSPAHQQWDTNEFYDTAGGVGDRFKQKSRQHTRSSIDVEVSSSIDVEVSSSIDRRSEFGKRAYHHDGTRRFHWEKKDEYGVYRDDHGHARDVDGHIISVSKEDIRSLLERASRDEQNYLCLPEHASSFTQTKLVQEIYIKDEINEMFYRVCGAQEKNEGDFQMKLDGFYFALNDSISWLTTCMEEMRQDIARIQTQRAAEATAEASIDRHHPTSIDDDLTHSNPMKSQPDSYTIAEIDQLIEAIHKEIVEIQGYIARRPEASASIDRRNNKSTDNRRRTSVDEATNRGRLVQKMKTDMSDTHRHGEEISDDAYVTLIRNQFQLESLDDRLQKI